MIKCPCYKCVDRHPACHDRCERYKAYKEAKEKEKKASKNVNVSNQHWAYIRKRK